MVIGVFALALVGIGLLVFGLFAVLRATNPAQVAAATHTATAGGLPTQVAAIPTTTLAPPTNTPEPTATPSQPPRPPPRRRTPRAPVRPVWAETLTPPTTSAGDTSVVTIVTRANVRGGPGTNYEVIGNIAEGDTVPVLGVSAGGGWYAIDFGGAITGRAWVSGQVAKLRRR